jgi:hypothetical protein
MKNLKMRKEKGKANIEYQSEIPVEGRRSVAAKPVGVSLVTKLRAKPA